MNFLSIINSSRIETSSGGTGKTTTQMKQASTFTGAEWDFLSIWSIDPMVNNGYPFLPESIRHALFYGSGGGGAVVGPNPQSVAHGADGQQVTAVADPGAEFAVWSDGETENPREDTGVTRPIQVTAHFRSLGGVDIDWYATHGIAPGAGQNWADLDGLDLQGKGMTLRMEFLAGTDPNNAAERFAAHLEGEEIHFHPSRSDRRYTLWRSVDLVEWTIVPGQSDVPGGNGPLIDTNPPGSGAFYRVEVALP